jgi:hypothetical protein
MGKIAKRPTVAPATRGRARKPVKKRTNLTLDADVVLGGEQSSRRHGTSISQLVNDFLRTLLAREGEEGAAADNLTPAVRRLYGIAAGRSTDREAYRAHLVAKYGGQT